MRWTTGIGIAVGGVGGAIAALMGAPKAPAPLPPVTHGAPAAERALATAPASAVEPSTDAAVTSAEPGTSAKAVTSAEPATSAEPVTPAELAAAAPTFAAASPSAAAPAAATAPSATPPTAVIAAPSLDVPKTREALLKAELYCDQKKNFDECERAAQALETGTTGPVDLEQAKRFRRIALTHLVMQCESGSAHACFVLAAKYRAGTELASKPASAEALEKRGAELCRLGRTAPECPSSNP